MKLRILLLLVLIIMLAYIGYRLVDEDVFNVSPTRTANFPTTTVTSAGFYDENIDLFDVPDNAYIYKVDEESLASYTASKSVLGRTSETFSAFSEDLVGFGYVDPDTKEIFVYVMVETSSFESNNVPRDESFRNLVSSQPAKLTISNYTFDSLVFGEPFEIEVPGVIELGEDKQNVLVSVSGTVTEETFDIEASMPISLTGLNLETPSLGGSTQIQDTVDINVTATATRKQ